MHVMIDQTACTGCGICAEICPETFTMGDDQHAHVTRPSPEQDHVGCIYSAAVDCPVSAINM